MTFDYIITDYITGKPVRNMGSEASRQICERFLIHEKGYSKKEAVEMIETMEYKPFDKTRKEREMIIYRSFNLEKINI